MPPDAACAVPPSCARQVKRAFSRCVVVGKSFPVCQVYVEGTMIEARLEQCSGLLLGACPPACPACPLPPAFVCPPDGCLPPLLRTPRAACPPALRPRPLADASLPACTPAPPPTAVQQVSSFSTNADAALIPADASCHMLGRQKPKARPRGRAGSALLAGAALPLQRLASAAGSLTAPLCPTGCPASGPAPCSAGRARARRGRRRALPTRPAVTSP